jgi:hypothetical protein
MRAYQFQPNRLYVERNVYKEIVFVFYTLQLLREEDEGRNNKGYFWKLLSKNGIGSWYFSDPISEEGNRYEEITN